MVSFDFQINKRLPAGHLWLFALCKRPQSIWFAETSIRFRIAL